MPSPETLFAELCRLGIETTTVHHPPLFTVEESRQLRGELPGGHTKNLFVKDKKGRYFLLVAEESAPLDLKALHRRIGAQGRLSFARPEEMRDLLGVEPGSVTAFGVMNDSGGRVTLVLDQALMDYDMINCHPLTNEATTSIRREDLLAFFSATRHEPLVIPLAEGERPHTDPNGQEAP